MSLELEKTLDPYLEAACGRKATDLVALDVRELTSYADIFLIMSAASTRQVKAIADHVRRSLKKQKIRAMSVDGVEEGQWVLMDYGDILIHIFYEPVRGFYDLEGLWADAKPVAEDRIAELSAGAGDMEEDEDDGFWDWEDDDLSEDA